jgi:hypothetical protein
VGKGGEGEKNGRVDVKRCRIISCLGGPLSGVLPVPSGIRSWKYVMLFNNATVVYRDFAADRGPREVSAKGRGRGGRRWGKEGGKGQGGGAAVGGLEVWELNGATTTFNRDLGGFRAAATRLRQQIPRVQKCVLYTTPSSGPPRSLRGGSPEAQNSLRNIKRAAPIVLAGASAPMLREAACFMSETYFGPPAGPLGASGEGP